MLCMLHGRRREQERDSFRIQRWFWLFLAMFRVVSFAMDKSVSALIRIGPRCRHGGMSGHPHTHWGLVLTRHCNAFAEVLGKYEVEGDALQSYAEFQLAATIYGALIEGAASEQSARMQAMENATKNAGVLVLLEHRPLGAGHGTAQLGQGGWELGARSTLFFLFADVFLQRECGALLMPVPCVYFAGEMIDKLRLQYNRTRQAVITNELIEIISGASAV
jgi:hypothetical protein